MNRLICLGVVLLLILSLPVSSNAALPFSVGAKIGVNIANVSYDPDIPSQIKKSGRTAIAFGGVAELGLGGIIFVSAEPMYIQKGSKLEGPFFYDLTTLQPVNGSSTAKVSFLEIPLLVKAKIPMAGSVKPYFFGGPTIGFTLTSKSTDEAPGYGSQESDDKDKTSSIDFGFTFGGGAEFKVAPKIALTGDVRYALGLTDLSKSQPNEQTHTKVKSNGIQFFVGALVTI